MRPAWHERLHSRAEAAGDVLLAVVIGIIGAVALFYWWST